jgi:D-3-phosphoglycerate dehydrogenase
MALILALARNVPQASAALRAGTWDRKPYLGVELKDKSIGVIGFGRIGREVARRAQAMEMKVIAYDPYMSERVAADLGIELVGLDELLPQVDVLTVHVPMSKETHHLIDAEALARMKPGARVINCARGGLIDEKALLANLESGHIAGAAFDVFENEPDADPELLAHPRFIGTPHLGGATLEAQEKIGEGISQQIADFLTDGTIHHAINVQALPPEEQRPMLPYIDLSRRLGSMLSQCYTGIDVLRVEYFGDISDFTTRPVSAAVLVGFFEPHLDEQVNPVNVWNVARERGIEVTESTSNVGHGYSSLVRVSAHLQWRALLRRNRVRCLARACCRDRRPAGGSGSRRAPAAVCQRRSARCGRGGGELPRRARYQYRRRAAGACRRRRDGDRGDDAGPGDGRRRGRRVRATRGHPVGPLPGTLDDAVARPTRTAGSEALKAPRGRGWVAGNQEE